MAQFDATSTSLFVNEDWSKLVPAGSPDARFGITPRDAKRRGLLKIEKGESLGEAEVFNPGPRHPGELEAEAQAIASAEAAVVAADADPEFDAKSAEKPETKPVPKPETKPVKKPETK